MPILIPKSKFTNSMGLFLTKALFYETTLADKSTVVYTLKDQDHLGYPSLYRIYMDMGDLTEYDFASTHLGSWSHWETLTATSWFKPYITRWRKELELRTRAVALRGIQEIGASTESKDHYKALQFLVNAGWKPPAEKRRAGAPSKEEVKAEAHRIALTEHSLLEDFNRITEKAN